MSDLIIHRSISDLYKAMGLQIEQEMDFTIHFLPDIHTDLPYKSPTFRADYYSFVFVKDGKGSYTTDSHTFPTSPGTIYFTNPGHIKAFYMEDIKDVYIITLTEVYLREHVHQDIFEEFPFLLAETVPPKVLPEEQFREFETLYTQIFKEYHEKSAFKDRILANLFVVLLLKIKEKFWSDYSPIEEGDRSSAIVKNFKRNLEKHFVELSKGESSVQYQVQDYARELHLHPNYFSSVIKAKTGKSVQQWIADKVIATARELLVNTSKTSKEISYQLGFSEPTHFNSYFKKRMGMTPKQYRTGNQNL